MKASRFFAVAALTLLALIIGATVNSSCGGTVTYGDLYARVVQVLDNRGHEVSGIRDFTNLPATWQVLVEANDSRAELKISGVSTHSALTHGDLPTSPTIGDEYYRGGDYYYWWGNGWYRSRSVLPGELSVTPNSTSQVWVASASDEYIRVVLVPVIDSTEARGRPALVGLNPNVQVTIQFPPVTQVVIGQPYILNIGGGYLTWELPSQGMGLYTVWNGQAVMIGTLIMNSNEDLVATFNQVLAEIMNQIPAGQAATLTVTFTVNGVEYSFTITVVGTGGGDGTGGVIMPIE